MKDHVFCFTDLEKLFCPTVFMWPHNKYLNIMLFDKCMKCMGCIRIMVKCK